MAKRATMTVAVAHSLLATAHCLLPEPGKPYADLGTSYFDEPPQTAATQADRLVRKLRHLGYTVEAKKPAA